MARINKAIGTVIGGVLGLVIGLLVAHGLVPEESAEALQQASQPWIELAGTLLGGTLGTYLAPANQ